MHESKHPVGLDLDELSTPRLEEYQKQVESAHNRLSERQLREFMGRELYCIGQIMAERGEP